MKRGGNNKLKVFFSVLLLVVGLLAVIVLVNRGIEGNVIASKGYSIDKCTDSDGGINIYTKGTVKRISSVTTYYSTDICSGTTKIIERYCANSKKIGSKLYSCTTGYRCYDGACISTTSGNNQTNITNSTNTTNWNNQTNMTNITNQTNWSSGNNWTNNQTNWTNGTTNNQTNWTNTNTTNQSNSSNGTK